MASHYADNILYGDDHPQDHASANRWRHQESSAYRRHASKHIPKEVREADERNGVLDLSTFLNQSRIEGTGDGYKTSRPVGPAAGGKENGGLDPIEEGVGAQNPTGAPMSGHQNEGYGRPTDGREVRCGPLINYRRMEGNRWFGSVLIVTRGGIGDSGFEPELVLRRVGARNGAPDAPSNNHLGLDGAHVSRNSNWFNGLTYNDLEQRYAGQQQNAPPAEAQGSRENRVKGVKLYGDLRNVFWRFQIEVQMEDEETQWAYEIPGLKFSPGSKKSDKQSFFVPAITESFRIMFHSCNGFSVGTDEEAWSGPALWNDVVRVHQETPFHVMIGGGDQIYNDGIRVHGPLRAWTDIRNPKKRKHYKFPESLRKDCDDYYVSNYIRWYSTEPFASANGQIPQLNLWDDHDIIDGFGSYVNDFMKCDVFRGIGGTAYKYYMLFQHHLAPPVSTYTTDAPQTTEAGPDGVGADPVQLKDTYVLTDEEEDPSYIIGVKPGPYVAEHSRSIYTRLGARIAFFGIDARTERTRHQINYPETYEKIFNRVRRELGAAADSSSPIKHLIVLLGIPIAYPRLTWLENILSSPLIGPIKFLHKRFGVGGGLFNQFDGGVDLLDDLDDHYTAKTHKKERLWLVQELQKISAEFSVRITVLGGDVHLAAVGRFYSNPKLGIPARHDHRYIANIVSSAIVNKPPPAAIANLLARRNKIHHLDESTDETLMDLFDKNPGKSQKSANWNHTTMPSRNFAMITENPLSSNASTGAANANASSNHYVNGNGNGNHPSNVDGAAFSHPNGDHNDTHSISIADDECTGQDGHSPLHMGEVHAGSESRAVTQHGQSSDGSLDVVIRVEMEQHDGEGRTLSYGLYVPLLEYRDEVDGGRTLRKRDNIVGAVHGHAHTHARA